MSTIKFAVLGAVLFWAASAHAQPAPAAPPLPAGFHPPAPTPNDTLVSPIVAADGTVTVSLYAPQAHDVLVSGECGDFGAPPTRLVRSDNGVWTTSIHAAPGTYRYTFNVDGAQAVDPRNTNTSRSQTTVRSLVTVPGKPWEDYAAVPHGAVEEVWYPSTTFSSPRRMHVYTPPGYGTGGRRYPVLYLLHGGGDSDDSWSTVGRAGFILDNLIAAGKAVPMIVVMPAGHIPAADGTIASASNAMSEDPANDRFTDDFLNNIVPYVEKSYRTTNTRAIAGLSMGGLQAANIGLVHADMFPSVLIYSSGWFPQVATRFEQRWGTTLDADRTRLKLLWIGYGETDIARANAEAAKAMFDRHGLTYRTEMTPGGHVWANWRHYLTETAPLLFK